MMSGVMGGRNGSIQQIWLCKGCFEGIKRNLGYQVREANMAVIFTERVPINEKKPIRRSCDPVQSFLGT